MRRMIAIAVGCAAIFGAARWAMQSSAPLAQRIRNVGAAFAGAVTDGYQARQDQIRRAVGAAESEIARFESR